eukprot:364282-Chlamydomonas_euryale.AAC.16
MEDQGFDPVMSNKTWSAPWQDPQLVGDKPRNVWVLTKDSAGADLLSSEWRSGCGELLRVALWLHTVLAPQHD